jgi:hypothetical protein
MSIADAAALLEARLQKYRMSSYGQLLPFLNHPAFSEGIAPSGATFRMEISVFWEKYPHGNLRVFGLVDAFYPNAVESPVTQTFLVEPEAQAAL